uniref:Patatin-like phospholipase domain-containing protein (EC) n=1 Tax=Ganoderma boninense TaxID=34458 RepID=A0A5K1JY28_9APHY|nr:Patatin-like phospholipase domain-containing protein (EC [Ganoderma boninense]
MGFFHHESDEAQAYEQVTNAPHKAELSHELIAAAASYEAAKAYEQHVAKNGKPDSHAKAKELMAGFAGAFIDRMVETKGLDFIDKERAKAHSQEKVEEFVTVDNY